MTHQHGGRELRTDIQGLRALAVTMVVLFHLHAAALPGGYVGVDVFFVISGFLITNHLLSRPPAGPGDLLTFWGRRLRRLLPASLTVLAATLVAVRFLAPATVWEANATDARSAALYVVNWGLARRAVDYLAADNAPTAFQHFWSLSVEEQFYFGWPMLIGLCVLLATRLRLPRRVVLGAGLGTVVLASMAFSISRTGSDPASAYFITTTRIWELGIGGLLALLVGWLAGPGTRLRLPPLARMVAAWSGMAMMLIAALNFTSETAFPGYAAALPVLGAALFILADTQESSGLPGRLLALPPIQWLGDISYSVYLWHWPLIVLYPYAVGHSPELPGLLAIVTLTLLLAALSERFVERRFRDLRVARLRTITFAGSTAGMAIVIAIATLQLAAVSSTEAQARHALAAAIRTGGPCFGAAALDPGKTCPAPGFDDVVPTPLLALNDHSAAYEDVGGRACRSLGPTFRVVRCTFGDRHADVTVAMVGNSHADQWLPAMQVIAKERHWRIETFFASRCAAADVLQALPTEASAANCQRWSREVVQRVARRDPALVIYSNRMSAVDRSNPDAEIQATFAAGYRRELQAMLDAGLRVAVLQDTPTPRFLVPECVAQHEDDLTACDGSLDDFDPHDPVSSVVEGLADDRLALIDVTDHICDGPVCHVVTGGVITYADETHLTATYSHTLAPYLEQALLPLLEASDRGGA